MTILHRRGRATAAQVQEELPDPPGYSAVRSALRLLEERDLVHHERDGQRFVFFPAVPQERVRSSALGHVLRTFFGGSQKQAISALLEDSDLHLSDDEFAKLSRLLDEARRRGKV